MNAPSIRPPPSLCYCNDRQDMHYHIFIPEAATACTGQAAAHSYAQCHYKRKSCNDLQESDQAIVFFGLRLQQESKSNASSQEGYDWLHRRTRVGGLLSWAGGYGTAGRSSWIARWKSSAVAGCCCRGRAVRGARVRSNGRCARWQSHRRVGALVAR